LDEQVLAFEDGDGLMLEIVATPLADDRSGWDGAPGITAASAIRAVHGVTLWEGDAAPTASVLVDLLGLERIAEDAATERFEPGGVLFELATDGPGFEIDERRDQLGEQLMLPPQYETVRAQLTDSLPEIHAPAPAGAHYREE